MGEQSKMLSDGRASRGRRPNLIRSASKNEANENVFEDIVRHVVADFNARLEGLDKIKVQSVKMPKATSNEPT